jgi:hypothetical protein
MTSSGSVVAIMCVSRFDRSIRGETLAGSRAWQV